MNKRKQVKESTIEDYLNAKIAEHGGFTRKIQYIGRRGCADRLVVLPGGILDLVELKRPDVNTAAPHQQREHRLFRDRGVHVYLLNTKELIDEYIKTRTTSVPTDRPRPLTK